MFQLPELELQLLLAYAILLGIAFIYGIVWHQLYDRAQKTKSILDASFLDALHWPFYGLLLLYAVTISIPYFPIKFFALFRVDASDFDLLFPVGFTTFVLVVFNVFLSNVQNTILEIQKTDPLPNGEAWISACKLGRVISILVFCLVVFNLLEIPMGQFLAPTAVGAFALSFASKDLLSNVFGGVMVMCDQPFAVGSFVKIGNNEEGTVRYIGWRMTQVQLRNGRILHVPNGLIATSVVTNYSEKTHWYIQKEIGLRYKDLEKAALVAKDIEQWLDQHDYVNHRRDNLAKLFDLTDSSVVLRVRVYLKSSISTRQWYEFTEELLLAIQKIVKTHKADFAFPTRTVLLEGKK